MQITSPSKISMVSPRNGQSPKSKLHRVISAQLRSIKKSQCQSQIVLINKTTKQSVKQQNYVQLPKQYQTRQIQYVQLIKELHMENKKLKQKLSMEQVNPINMSLQNEKKCVSPSISPNMKMRLSPNSSFNKSINNQTHKRNFTVVNSSAIPLCSPLQVHHQNQKSGQNIRSPISYKSPIKNYTNVFQSVNYTPKRSFQTIQALNSQVFYGSNIKVNQNYSSPRVIENNSIVLQTQSFKKKEKNETVQYVKNCQKQEPRKPIIPHMNQRINQNITYSNPNFVNKLHFSYTKKDEKNDNLQEVKTGTQMQKLENPLKLLQKEFDKLAQNRKIQQKHAEKFQKKGQSQYTQKQQANQSSITKQQSLKTTDKIDFNKNIHQNETLNNFQKRIYEQFCDNVNDDNEQHIQNSQSQKDTKNVKGLAQSQSSSEYQVSSNYNKNIRYSRNNRQQRQIENSHQQQKQMIIFEKQKDKLQTTNNLQQKNLQEQSRNNIKENIGLSNLNNQSQNSRQGQRERQPQSIDNLLQQQKGQNSKIQEEAPQNKISKEQQKVEIFHEVQNSLEEKQKLTQCYQYKLFYATASTPVQQKQNQFKVNSQRKQDTKTKCQNNKAVHWRTPGISQTMSKTDNNYHQCKFNRFGDSNVSMNSLRSKKYSRISNKAYL